MRFPTVAKNRLHVDAEDFVVLLIGHDLHGPIGFARHLRWLLRLALEGGEGNERGGAGLPDDLILIGVGLRRLERLHARPQLAVLVSKLPVRFGEPLKPFRGAARADERGDRKRDGAADQQPLKGQQKRYLSERLATVSTACDNTARRPNILEISRSR
jgi:hypothetical protein